MDANVWHVKHDLLGKDGRTKAGGFAWGAESLMFPRDYVRVASVTPPDDRRSVELGLLGYVFEMTNHIDHDWTENEGIMKYGTRHRSTSVGDVVQYGAKYFMCMPCGWVEMPANSELFCIKNELVNGEVTHG